MDPVTRAADMLEIVQGDPYLKDFVRRTLNRYSGWEHGWMRAIEWYRLELDDPRIELVIREGTEKIQSHEGDAITPEVLLDMGIVLLRLVRARFGPVEEFGVWVKVDKERRLKVIPLFRSVRALH